ncbi:MAG: hypothetical protein EXR51_08090 [Dehalococcoidia bacterium]|nr:hypothetical protein [Dehalococcoidia bacterium]
MSEVIISADSHVMEPHDLWSTRLPEALRSAAAVFPAPQSGPGFDHHPGGSDPHARIKEMAVDGVSAEVLYPTLGLRLFGIDDAATQEACFRIYNDWLIDYCAVNNDRLLGIPALSVYNIDAAVAELQRTHKAGLAGAIIWQTPHPDLPFTSRHYDKLWAAAQDLDAPVALHILTGHNYTKKPNITGTDVIKTAVNAKMNDTLNGLFDIMISGTLDRFPRLKVVIVESEIGWMPFYFQQWDYYFRRFNKSVEFPISVPPSEYIERGQVWATFFNDTVGGHNLGWWGQEVCMWSSDYPHPNSPWPNSLKVIERDLGHLPGEVRAKLVRENVARLYHMRVPETVAVG